MLFQNDSMFFGVLTATVIVSFLSTFVIKKISQEKRRRMLVRYSALRKQSLDLQKTMSDQLLADSAENITLNGELSCNDFYRQLKSNHVYNLSDKYLSKVKKSNNLLFLNKAERNLEEQEQKLKDAEQLLMASLVLQ